jgi:hypothetical protein
MWVAGQAVASKGLVEDGADEGAVVAGPLEELADWVGLGLVGFGWVWLGLVRGAWLGVMVLGVVGWVELQSVD